MGWSPDGSELFYLHTPLGPPRAVMGVRIEVEESDGPGAPDRNELRAGQPEELFAWSFYDQNLPHHRYAVLPDGHFLMIESDVLETSDSPYDLIVVQNWHQELERLVPVE